MEKFIYNIDDFKQKIIIFLFVSINFVLIFTDFFEGNFDWYDIRQYFTLDLSYYSLNLGATIVILLTGAAYLLISSNMNVKPFFVEVIITFILGVLIFSRIGLEIFHPHFNPMGSYTIMILFMYIIWGLFLGSVTILIQKYIIILKGIYKKIRDG